MVGDAFSFGFVYNSLSAYSVRRLFTGLAIAALIAWKLTVISVMASAPTPETIKTQNEILVL